MKIVEENMFEMLSLVDRISIIQLPRAGDCAVLIAIAKGRLEREKLFQNVEYWTMGPGVIDSSLDWQDRHEGCNHPIFALYTNACTPQHICIDYSRGITEDEYVNSRLGLDISTTEPQKLKGRKKRLLKLRPYFDTYNRYGSKIFDFDKEYPSSISIHNADMGLCYGYKHTRFTFYFERLSSLSLEDNQGHIPRIRQLTRLLRQTQQGSYGDRVTYNTMNVVLPYMRCGYTDSARKNFENVVRNSLYDIMESFSYSKRENDLAVLRAICNQVEVQDTGKADNCICCGGR